MNAAPFEIVAAPFSVYWAPVGEAFPDVDEVPGGNWALIGTSGDRDYTPDGVAIVFSQTIEKIRGAGSTGPRKATRTEEDLMVRFSVFDNLLAAQRLAHNNNAIATTAAGSGTPGFKEIPVYKGLDVAQLALLARGPSPEANAAWQQQLEIPVCYQSGSPEPVFNKAGAAGMALEFTALEDPNAATSADRFGRLVQQHQTAI